MATEEESRRRRTSTLNDKDDECKCPDNVKTFADVCEYCSNQIINEGLNVWRQKRRREARTE